ncbi:MAG: tetratricopeptide repeat protein, partial [Cyanobacteria bacterium J06635_1]
NPTIALVYTTLQGIGRVVYVRGEAGIGKTRLLQEFRQLTEQQGVICHSAAILDFGVGSGRDVFRQLAVQLLGLSEAEDRAKREDQVKQFLQQTPLSEMSRTHLNALLDLPQSREAQSIYEAMDNQTRLREKVRVVNQLVSVCSQKQAMLIVLEDLHWIDTSSLSQLAHFVVDLATCPVLLVITSRIEGDPIDMFWRKQIPQGMMQCLDLEPLSHQESLVLVHSYAELDPTLALGYVRRADGNPLFLEQLVRSHQSILDPQLPGSLQSVVLGRVDQLDAADKTALQAASVLGQRFSLPILRYLLGEPTYTCENLVESFLVYPEGEGYRFGHALIHDGVYLALLKARRQQLHRLAASWYAERDLDLRAAHLDRADAAEAAGAYYQAANDHYQSFRYDLALSLSQRGLELAVTAIDRYNLTCLMAKLVQAVGNPAESVELYREAVSLATTDLQACQAWVGVAAGVRLSGGYDEGVIALDRAFGLVKGSDAARVLSQIHYFRGNFCYSSGDLEGCLAAQQQALDYALQVKDPELEARALGGLADAVYASKRMKTAMDYYQRCVEVAQQHGFVQIEMANRHMLASMMRYMHDFEGAIANNQLTLETARQIGNRRTLMYTFDNQGELLTEQGDYDLASQSIESALELSFSLNNKRYRAYIMQRLARVRICQEQDLAARVLLEDALQICYETDLQFVAPRVLGLLALVTANPQESGEFLHQGDHILSQGCISHNFLWFYRDAIEASLKHQDWDRANHYASLLKNYTQVEPFPWSQFVVGRGRCLAAIGSGHLDSTVIQQLRQLQSDAEQVRLGMALPAIITALGQVGR